MNKMRKISGAIAKLAVTALVSGLLVAGTIASVSAAEYGEWWTSDVRYNFTGCSTVGTTNISGSTKKVNLWVLRSTGDEMGYSQKKTPDNETVSHTCWGQPFLDRYGSVQVPAGSQRNPFFHENG